MVISQLVVGSHKFKRRNEVYILWAFWLKVQAFIPGEPGTTACWVQAQTLVLGFVIHACVCALSLVLPLFLPRLLLTLPLLIFEALLLEVSDFCICKTTLWQVCCKTTNVAYEL